MQINYYQPMNYKNKILFLILFFCFTGCFRKQVLDYYEKKFYGKWTFKNVYLAERKKKNYLSEYQNVSLEFKPAGEFIINQNGKEAIGKWRTKNLDLEVSFKDSTGEKSKSESNLLLSLVTEKQSFISLNILAEVSFWKNEMILRDRVKNQMYVYELYRN